MSCSRGCFSGFRLGSRFHFVEWELNGIDTFFLFVSFHVWSNFMQWTVSQLSCYRSIERWINYQASFTLVSTSDSEGNLDLSELLDPFLCSDLGSKTHRTIHIKRSLFFQSSNMCSHTCAYYYAAFKCFDMSSSARHMKRSCSLCSKELLFHSSARLTNWCCRSDLQH